jgi:YidC/Oxa1 family membrane protein insertase
MYSLFDYIITKPMGFIIEFIYSLVSNYGLSIILFTILIKLVLLPLTIKSQKAMKKQQKIQPIMQQLQAKYANDQEKLQREMMKLYKENNISMTGGCLPMLIQMPILVGLYQVIQKPLSFLAGVDWAAADVINKVIDLQARMATQFPDIIGKLTGYTMEQLANNAQIQLSKWSEILNGATDPWVLNFNFLGLDLSNAPAQAISYLVSGQFGELRVIMLLLIPILAVAATILSNKVMQAQTQAKDPDGKTKQPDSATQMTKSMTMLMPIMTGFFTFTLPSGLGIYWIISSLVQVIQQVALNRYFDKKEADFVVNIPETLNRKKGKKRK